MLGGRRSVLSNRIEEAFRDRRSCISLTPLGSTATRRGFTGHVAQFTVGLKALSVVVIRSRRRQSLGPSPGARLRPRRASAGSIEIFPAARAMGATMEIIKLSAQALDQLIEGQLVRDGRSVREQ